MDLTNALTSLFAGKHWIMRGNTYSGLEWMDTTTPKPTEEELVAEAFRLHDAYENAEYQRKRAAEYPPMSDYLDGVVKGDQQQIDAYIAACLEVKAKYPK